MEIQHFTFKDYRIAYRQYGSGPDALLHGFPTSSYDGGALSTA